MQQFITLNRDSVIELSNSFRFRLYPDDSFGSLHTATHLGVPAMSLLYGERQLKS